MLFISPQKFFSFSRYLRFCLDILVMYRNDLMNKIRLISNFMASHPGQKTILIHFNTYWPISREVKGIRQ